MANSKSDFNRSLDNSTTSRFPAKRATTLFSNRPLPEVVIITRIVHFSLCVDPLSSCVQDLVSPADGLVSQLELYVCRNMTLQPNQLRQSRMLEIFIVNIHKVRSRPSPIAVFVCGNGSVSSYQVLDHNTEFGKTPKLIAFVLRLLGHCASPSAKDYQPMDTTKTLGCKYSLSTLPVHLQTPWIRVVFVVLYKVREEGEKETLKS